MTTSSPDGLLQQRPGLGKLDGAPVADGGAPDRCPFGQVRPDQHPQQAQPAAHQAVDERQQHPEMVPATLLIPQQKPQLTARDRVSERDTVATGPGCGAAGLRNRVIEPHRHPAQVPGMRIGRAHRHRGAGTVPEGSPMTGSRECAMADKEIAGARVVGFARDRGALEEVREQLGESLLRCPPRGRPNGRGRTLS